MNETSHSGDTSKTLHWIDAQMYFFRQKATKEATAVLLDERSKKKRVCKPGTSGTVKEVHR